MPARTRSRIAISRPFFPGYVEGAQISNGQQLIESTDLLAAADAAGGIPLAWAKPGADESYVNLGDALSPVMVSLVSGRPIVSRASRSSDARLAAVGTIGHGMRGGHVTFWGTGSSRYANPLAARDERVTFSRSGDTVVDIRATRGPVSARILGEGLDDPGVYGDPVWLLPRFFPRKAAPTTELGVILHLSELADRGMEARAKDGLARYDVPQDLAGSVRLITMVTGREPSDLRGKVEEILDCKRIVSTSLHGVVIAEAYGIPCFYLARRGEPGVDRVDLDGNEEINLRLVDLYLGLGQERLTIWRQPPRRATDWEAVMSALDREWEPKDFDGDRLIDAFPLPPAPLTAPEGKTVFEHPLIAALHPHRGTLPIAESPAGIIGRLAGRISRLARAPKRSAT